MSKARIFPRTPRPKLQPRPLADRVRRTNISISNGRRERERERERASDIDVDIDIETQNSNGSKNDCDDCWHRQELGNTYVTQVDRNRKLVIRFKPTLPVLIALFVCVVFLDSVQWVNRQYAYDDTKSGKVTTDILDYDLGGRKTFSDNENENMVQSVLHTSTSSIPAMNDVAGIGAGTQLQTQTQMQMQMQMQMQTKESIRDDGHDTDTLYMGGGYH